MNAVAEVRTAVSVALLGPADAAREQLRQALVVLGADLVFEGEVRQGRALVGRAPQVLIVNLEPGVEDDLDALQELLDSPETSVVFNEGEVSSQLTGWDLARWARHLAAKVLGVRNTLPPLPTGAERLPELSVLPEPGRPLSPSQQQDHLRFDDFAEEALGHSDEVPSSPRLDLAQQAPVLELNGLDFDFSPVQAAEPAAAASAPDPRASQDSDALESMDLSALFEQDLSQVTPDDMLLKLQQAMGLDPMPAPAAVAPAAPLADTAASAPVIDRPAVPSNALESIAPHASAVADPELDEHAGPVEAQLAQTAARAPVPQDQTLTEFDRSDLTTLEVGDFEDVELSTPRVESQRSDAGYSEQASVAAAGTGLDFSFDPVAFEAELEDDSRPASRLAVDADAADVADSFDAPLELDTFDFRAFDAAVDSVDAAGEAEPVPLARFDAEDASLGGTLTLDSEVDDEEIARLAAALDEQPTLPSSVDLPPLEFDLPRAASKEPVEPSPPRAAAPAARVEAAPTAPPTPRKGFGELSLQPLDDGFIDPGVKAPEAPARTFDFSHLTLSLEPIEAETPAAPSHASSESTAATMRDGAWLRDLHEMPQPTVADTDGRAVADSPAEIDGTSSLDPVPAQDDPDAAFDFTPAAVVPPPIPAAARPPAAAAPLGGSISRVIVLCASIGGPDAVRSFLSAIPSGFPALFLVVQHLENGYFERLAQQLQKACKLPVRVPMAGLPARDGEVLVVASGSRFRLAPEGSVELGAPNTDTRYRPCIDDVLQDVAETFGAHAHAIIFSGMAADAVEGSVYLNQRGGTVWAQDPESCVVSSMVDGARARGVVDYIGSPAELARRCAQHYA